MNDEQSEEEDGAQAQVHQAVVGATTRAASLQVEAQRKTAGGGGGGGAGVGEGTGF